MMKHIILCSLLFISTLSLSAQTNALHDAVHAYFRSYSLTGYRPREAMRADSLQASDSLHTINVFVNESFSSQPFTPQSVKRIYSTLQRSLPAPFNTYHLSIIAKGGMPIEDLIPNILREDNEDRSRLWGDVEYKGAPWVSNLSLPYQVTAGLQGRHLFIWPSHGRYYKNGSWQWQRPYLFCTTEDIFTQSFVYPYLFPMLEKAGAIIGCPRERDYQSSEAVVDNDYPDRQGSYSELEQEDAHWSRSNTGEGFAQPEGLLNDSIFPFMLGTWRSIPTTTRKSRLATATWMPRLPRAGRYAVYVSYATRPNSVPDAHYTVFHKGGRTSFQVNQQMGGSTWVYLGTFDFDEGCNPNGRVVLTNQSNYRGIVTADGVRFGGGVGQTERGTAGTSGLPRYLEAARYYAQWAGVPDSLVNTERGTDDYSDDLRARGNMLNYMAAGSPYVPNAEGRKVPFELSLALHSDAGMRSDQSIYGSLSISTSWDGEGRTVFPSGMSRQASSDLASLLLSGITSDLSNIFHTSWTRREHWNRNYAETRMPAVPSAILEMLSHQNFQDMKYGHDPNFKFALARSVYKTILRYVNHEHGIKQVTVQPLPPTHFAACITPDGNHVCLSWKASTDSIEPTAQPTAYIVYTKQSGEAFDNGQLVGNVTTITLPLTIGVQTDFRVTAINAGGESFPSETLTAYAAKESKHQALIVNGFTRLSGPAWVERGDSLGFDLNEDIGVPYLYTSAFAGRQTDFTNHRSEHNTGNELMGKVLAGNTFDYPVTHGQAIAQNNNWSFSSTSAEAFAEKDFNIQNFDVVDYIGGLQANKPYNLIHYSVFPQAVRMKLTNYLKEGGSLIVSGSFIGSDGYSESSTRNFTEQMLHFSYDGTDRNDQCDTINGLNLNFSIYREPCREHYAAQAPDALWPIGNGAFTAFAYGSGQSAGVAYKGKDYRTIAMGFPFECIKDANIRSQAMKAILQFLTE